MQRRQAGSLPHVESRLNQQCPASLLGIANHFFRDSAKPVLALDRTAKKKVRAKIRGLRACHYTHFLVENRRFLQGTMLPPGLSRSERQLKSYNPKPPSPLSLFARSPEASERKQRGDYRVQL